MIETIVYIIILIWGIGTTIYGLYLSRRNNEVYNQRILGELERINVNLEGLKNDNNKL